MAVHDERLRIDGDVIMRRLDAALDAVGVPPVDQPAAAAAQSAARRLDADEEEWDDEADVVRSFMITGGRTRTSVDEVPIETLVTASLFAKQNARGLTREQRSIVDTLSGGSLSVAEISAHLEIPLRAAVILVSEMVAAGTLTSGGTVDVVDTDFLSKIRNALQLL